VVTLLPAGVICVNGELHSDRSSRSTTELMGPSSFVEQLDAAHGDNLIIRGPKSLLCRKCMGSVHDRTVFLQAPAMQDAAVRIDAHLDGPKHRKHVRHGSNLLGFKKVCVRPGVSAIAPAETFNRDAVCCGYFRRGAVIDGARADVTAMHGERGNGWHSDAGEKARIKDADGKARAHEGTIFSDKCEVSSRNPTTGKPDGKNCCHQCANVVKNRSFKTKLVTRLAMDESESFGKTAHSLVGPKHLRLVLKNRDLKHSLKLRAAHNRSRASVRSAKSKSAENVLTGKARLLVKVKDLMRLHKSGKLSEKEAWFSVPQELLHTSMLKAVHPEGKRSKNMKWSVKVKRTFPMLGIGLVLLVMMHDNMCNAVTTPRFS
jgi:hypothetical protein